LLRVFEVNPVRAFRGQHEAAGGQLATLLFLAPVSVVVLVLIVDPAL
jgi:hypothetical protein